MSPGIRQVLLRGGSSLETKEVARREGMRTLVEDGWRLVREGVTTPAEVLRVSKEEDAVSDGRRRAKPCLTASCHGHFEYKAVAANGAISQGRLEAGGRGDAMQTLEDRGLTPLRLAEIGGSAPLRPPQAARRTATPAARCKLPALERQVVASIQEGSVLRAGGFHALAFQPAHGGRAAEPRADHPLQGNLQPGGRRQVARTARPRHRRRAARRRDGASPDVFPRIYVAMVEAGEAGGFLDVVLAQIADFQAREKELRAKVIAAMMYPAVLLTLAVGVVIFLLVFFIPRFQTLFEGFDAALPLLTRVIVGASDVVRHYGLYLLAGVGAAV